MASENTRSTSLINQLLLLLMAAMLLYLIAGFAHQVTVSREQQKELDRVGQQVAAELAERERLESDLAQAHSEAAIDAWVHENIWGAEGEVVVAPARGSEMHSDDGQMAPEDAVSGDSPQDAWWDLFFGTP